MTDNDEIIEVVKLKINDPIAQQVVSEWIIHNMKQIEFPSSYTLEMLIEVGGKIRENSPKLWKSECFDSFVSFRK